MSTHRQILKSIGIIGSSKVVTILIGIVRTKVIAILLGPLGIGIAGILQSTVDLIASLTHFGIEFSAVRDVAESAETKDKASIAKAITVLRRWSWFTGVLGMIITAIFCRRLSIIGFGNESYASGIAILSVTILISSISSGQMALLQGVRQLGAIAKSNILGVVIGFVITVPLYYRYGLAGIIPALFVSPIVSLCISWWYARKVYVEKVKISFADTVKGGIGMIKLGSFMVLSTFMLTGTMYLIRIIITSKADVDVVGQFQAVWTLSSVYLMTVINTMSVDYYPRLAGVNSDNKAVNLLVNEQMEITLLVSVPLIVIMLSFAPELINLFYSKSFIGATTILEWQLVGDFFKIIFFPIAYVLLAKGEGGYFIVSEFIGGASYLLFTYFGWGVFGKESIGMSYLFSRALYMFVVLLFVGIITGFRINKKVLRYIILCGVVVLLGFLNSYVVEGYKRYVFSSVLVLFSIMYSIYEINKIIDVLSFIKGKIMKNQ
jgi:PST family polysaccharide transporter